MLFAAPALQEVEVEVIGRIAELRASLRYATRNPVRWQGLLRRVSMARAIRASNSIEGYNVTEDEAAAAWDRQEPLDSASEAWNAVVCYRSAMTYVLALADDPHFSYSAALLKSLHFIMLEYDLRKHPGKWRPGPIYVRDERRDAIVYEAPNEVDAPGLIDELIACLNADAGGGADLVYAAMAHLNLVMIHPFADGNGRMARCLQTLALARGGVLAPEFASIEEYLGRNTDAYYAVLAEVGGGRWNPGRDTRPWIRFCLTAHFRQAETLLRRTREIGRLWSALEDEVAKKRLPERMTLALVDAALGYRVRNATYRNAAEVSMALASKDLRLLAREGFLEVHGERKGRHYAASERVREIRRKTRERKEMQDPFAAPSGRQKDLFG